jgi:hypothetical protein
LKPHLHAIISAKKYGGTMEEYMHFHEFFDSTKAHCADGRHRLLLHNSWGIFMLAEKFGALYTNSEGKIVAVRDIGEDHVLQDLGRIPAISEILDMFTMQDVEKLFKPKNTKKLSLEEFLKID